MFKFSPCKKATATGCIKSPPIIIIIRINHHHHQIAEEGTLSLLKRQRRLTGVKTKSKIQKAKIQGQIANKTLLIAALTVLLYLEPITRISKPLQPRSAVKKTQKETTNGFEFGVDKKRKQNVCHLHSTTTIKHVARID